MNPWDLQKVEPLEHVCYFLSALSLIEEVQLQRHVLLGLLHQPNKDKIWKQPVDNLKEKQYHRMFHFHHPPVCKWNLARVAVS